MPRWKWWWTILNREIWWNQQEGSACTHECPVFFLFKEGGKGHFFFSFVPNNVYPSCSHGVPIKFPNTFTKMFPIAPWFFIPYGFAQNSHPLYINWKVKSRVTHLFLISFHFSLVLNVFPNMFNGQASFQ